MVVTCPKCQAQIDDADQTTICPHPLIVPAEDLAQKKAGVALLGKEVTFRHQPDGPYKKVQSIGWNGMVMIEGFVGEFAPHLFKVKD